MGGLSLWHWLIVLVVVVLIFGTKRLRNLGQDLGESVRGFKKGMQDEDKSVDDRPAAQLPDATRTDETSQDAQRPPEQHESDRNDPSGPR